MQPSGPRNDQKGRRTLTPIRLNAVQTLQTRVHLPAGQQHPTAAAAHRAAGAHLGAGRLRRVRQQRLQRARRRGRRAGARRTGAQRVYPPAQTGGGLQRQRRQVAAGLRASGAVKLRGGGACCNGSSCCSDMCPGSTGLAPSMQRQAWRRHTCTLLNARSRPRHRIRKHSANAYGCTQSPILTSFSPLRNRGRTAWPRAHA